MHYIKKSSPTNTPPTTLLFSALAKVNATNRSQLPLLMAALTLRNSKCRRLSVQPHRVLTSTWTLPSQPCAQSGKRRKHVTAQPDEVLFSTWAVPSQPYSRHEKRCWRSRAHRSTITRLPSGASVSRSTSFRSGAFGLRGRYCPPMHGRVGDTSSHPRSARPLRGSLRSGNLIASRQAHPTVSFGVSLRIRSHLCGLWSRAEYRPSPYPRTSAAPAQPRLSQRLRPRG